MVLCHTPVELTAWERRFMAECEAGHQTDHIRYHDVTNPQMARRPYPSCWHATINQKDLGVVNSIFRLTVGTQK